MKAITLYQPWASLIAVGVKTIETRNWAPLAVLGQRIAIHAAKRPPRIQELPGDISWEWTKGLPRGTVVATARVVKVGRVHSNTGPHGTMKLFRSNHQGTALRSWQFEPFTPDKYGDYSLGRWLWFLADIKPVDPPISAVGRQGFWNWEEER